MIVRGSTPTFNRDIAPILARDFTVVCADLRGYGQSGCPASSPDHAPYAIVHVLN